SPKRSAPQAWREQRTSTPSCRTADRRGVPLRHRDGPAPKVFHEETKILAARESGGDREPPRPPALHQIARSTQPTTFLANTHSRLCSCRPSAKTPRSSPQNDDWDKWGIGPAYPRDAGRTPGTLRMGKDHPCSRE